MMTNQPDEHQAKNTSMNQEERAGFAFPSEGGSFEIHVRGHLNSQWSEWLEGLRVELLDNGEMILSGTIVDQAALMGILNKLHRLNLPIISVNELKRPDGR